MSNGERPEPDHLARQHVLEEEGLEDSQAVRVVQNGECGAQLEIADTTLWVSMVRNVDEALRAAYQEGQRAVLEKCGRENCLGWDAEGVRRWVTAQAADARERKAVEEALEKAAQTAERYSPSRPMGYAGQARVLMGRRQGEQIASENIARLIRALAAPEQATPEPKG